MEPVNFSSLILGSQLPDNRIREEADQHKIPETPPIPERDTLEEWLLLPELNPGLAGRSRDHIRDSMASWLSGKPIERGSITQLASAGPTTQHPPAFSTYVATLRELVRWISHDLLQNPQGLLSLNPSRRLTLLQHLNRLAGTLFTIPTQKGAIDELRYWIEGPRTPAHEHALAAYLEEVALVCLGQTLLLKAWSDRGLRKWSEKDLEQLNWSLTRALKPHIPMNREGWQLTRLNLYSWYNPAAAIRKKIWDALSLWNLKEESPALLAAILRDSRQHKPALPELQSYDGRFFQVLWERMRGFGFDPFEERAPGPFQRKKCIFTPTLRDASLMLALPSKSTRSMQWIGLESYPFQLLVAELCVLWWGPMEPPLWAQGSGLEVHSREQLSIEWNPASKPSALVQISEMEACDLAFVIEERAVRANGRSYDSAQLKAEIDGLPYYKNLRSNGSTLGDFQAYVAMSKLRPGSLLWWMREEPLSGQDGQEFLRKILDRGKLICEWDFSGIEHSLPARTSLFPKYIYLFSKEPKNEERCSNRPVSVRIHGQIRSHIEVPLLIEEALDAVQSGATSRGQWKIHVLKSPTPQQDWAERWPDASTAEHLQRLEKLRERSAALGQIATIRAINPGSSDPIASEKGMTGSGPALWVHCEKVGDHRQLHAEAWNGTAKRQSGFLVLVPEASWVAPLGCYLQSKIVTEWLDHYAERKAERWVLSEQVVRFIPVPKSLSAALSGAHSEALDPDHEALLKEVLYHPSEVRKALSPNASEEVSARFFVAAAEAFAHVQSGHEKLFSLITADGKIRWRELLSILPSQECIPFPLHSEIRISGMLPSHLPIHRIEMVRSPVPGIFLATESGLHTLISSSNSLLLQMLWQQLQDAKHPTWNELAQFVHLPRKPEFAQATASDILRSHGEQLAKKQALLALLADLGI